MSQAGSTAAGGGGGGSVNSVLGTANRITSSGGANPVIDIAATYVGQNSITTLGTITTGVWNGTVIGATSGGTGQSTYATGDILYASAPNTLSKLTAGSNTQILTLAGGVPTWAAPATSGTVTSVSGTANRITSTGGATPVIDISASYVGQSSITTLGTVSTGVWNGTAVDVSHGGTGDTTLTNHGVLIGQGTSAVAATATGSAGQVLQSGGAAADPAYSTATYPSTIATGDLLYGSATNVTSGLTVGDIRTIFSSSSTAPQWAGRNTYSELFTDFLGTTGGLYSGSGSGAGAGVSFTSSTNVDANHPGVITVACGTSGAGTARVQLYEKSVVLGGSLLWWETLINISALSDGTNTYTTYLGLHDNIAGTNPNNGIFFRYTHSVNSGNWQGVARAASSETVLNTSTAVAATTWIRLAIACNAAASLITFYINGSSVGTVNATIPTLPIGSQITITSTAGTVSRIVYVDYIQLVQVMTSR